MSLELKPCPFCGSEAKKDFANDSTGLVQYVYIVCTTCGAMIKRVKWETQPGNLEEISINAWNRRVYENHN